MPENNWISWIKELQILPVQEANGNWALPGGWVDYDQTIRTNAAKEVLEESGKETLFFE